VKPVDVASAFDPDRLRIARLAAGLRANQLAELVGVNSSAISQYEHGYTRPAAATLAQLALALGVPVRWFATTRPIGSVSEGAAHFRSLRASSKQERGRAFAQAVIAWDLCRVLETKVRLPDTDVPSIALGGTDQKDLDYIAWEVRQRWAVPDGPVAHVVRLLEQHGVIVLRARLDTRRVNAFSFDFGTRPLVVLGDDSGDTARSRFDAAHELGHLVMHSDAEPGDGLLERQAQGFASAFLLPARLVRQELPARFDLARLARLRQTWGVSIADGTYRRAVTRMSAMGHRTDESAFGNLGPAEEPILLGRAIELLAESGCALDELAESVGLPTERIIALLGSDHRPSVELSS
jgi:Zn-dependent peptidase ImmA (M78 family)/transcriptional regulator with XRE-family HTH domain